MIEQPEADTKNWTWVLERRCPECGFDTRLPATSDLAPLTADLSRRWDAAMAASADPTQRPSPVVWSPLEYACHVRDVFELASFRVGLMLAEDSPSFANWDQDETAIAEKYWEQDAGVVRVQLAAEGEEFARLLAAVPDDGWGRTGLRGDGSSFTVESFTRYLLHDAAHHVTDVTGERWD